MFISEPVEVCRPAGVGGYGVVRWNTAVVVEEWVRLRRQVWRLPAHRPRQAVNRHPDRGVAPSVTVVPASYVRAAGCLLTVPPPWTSTVSLTLSTDCTVAIGLGQPLEMTAR